MALAAARQAGPTDAHSLPIAPRAGDCAREQEAERQWWLGATDAGRRGLTAAAIAMPLLKGDWRNVGSAVLALAIAHQLCTFAKHTTSEMRPDGTDDQSFPSSHSLEAFSAATSSMSSVGPFVGLPAYTAAILVGYGRLRAQRHHMNDVVVGATAGTLASFFIGRAVNVFKVDASREVGGS